MLCCNLCKVEVKVPGGNRLTDVQAKQAQLKNLQKIHYFHLQDMLQSALCAHELKTSSL